jgi:hypothetical protein
MYVWQGRYQRERLNVLAETVSIHENDVSDELLRHELEEKFLYTSIEVIDAAIRGYLLTADGKLEIQAVEVFLKTGETQTKVTESVVSLTRSNGVSNNL